MKPGPDRVMTKTLVQELREDADTYYDQRADDNDCWNVTAALERKAADEIERLRSALESLLTAYEGLSHARACVGDPPDPEAVAARKALGAPVEPNEHYPTVADVMCTCGKRFGEHPIQPPWWPCMVKSAEKSISPPTDWEKARDVVAEVVRELGGEARIGATLALNAIEEAMRGTLASPEQSPEQLYRLRPLCTCITTGNGAQVVEVNQECLMHGDSEKSGD